jgi:hypothetical protein
MMCSGIISAGGGGQGFFAGIFFAWYPKMRDRIAFAHLPAAMVHFFHGI